MIQRERGAEMQRDGKRQQLRRVLIDMHADQTGNEQRMAETG